MINRLFNYKVNLAFEKYQDIPDSLPAIIICNQNAFNEQYTFSYIKDKFNFNKDNCYYNEYIIDYEVNQFEFINEILCQYNGHSCSEINGDFKRFWNNFYGNCYTFNGGNNSYLTGDQNGLHLEMIVSK
jgi:hypothetical protein